MLQRLSYCLILALPVTAANAQHSEFPLVTDAMLQNPAPADWLMWRRTLDGAGYSPLKQIDRDNVRDLELAWSLRLEDQPSEEGMALAYNGILYYPAALDVTLALDGATGELLWDHRRKLPEDLGRYVPFPQTNRNLAIYANLIIDNGADDMVYAIDARNGELAWETRILDYKLNPAKQGSGPIIVNGRVISGRHCAPQGGPDACIITAHDALTGKELWRRRTIPRPSEPGGDTWGDVPYEDRWQVGSWMVPSYDPKLDLVYVGTSVTAPSPKYMLAGNDKTYLYHNSTLAIDPSDGRLVWHYQHLVDHWDLDHAFERILIDTAVAPDPEQVPWINPRLVAGEMRSVVTGIPGKTGLVYTLDRATGEFLWARPTIRQNVVADIDAASGAVEVNPDTLFTAPDQQRFICPSTGGGKNWPAGSYDPDNETMYFPMANTCMNVSSIAEKATPDMTYAIDAETIIAPDTDDVGTIVAISAVNGRLRWQHQQRAGLMGLVATGGRLLFNGDISGHFRALDTETGDVLWEVDLGAPVTGQPMTFAVDGKQFVSVSTGRANLTGTLGRLTPEARADGNESALYVFSLPD
jgi:PQQ-dependent dehydrogenase (methanol/ethanol family)